MAILVACPSCRSKYNAPDKAAGRRTKCPKCGGTVNVPAAAPAPNQSARLLASAVATAPAPPPLPASPPRAPVAPPPPHQIAAVAPAPPASSHHKDCPFCGEQVRSIAKKCRHCGEMLDGAPRHRSAEPFAAPVTNVVVQQSVQQTSPVVVYGASKSVAAAIVLAFLFGPLGMLYATVPGALVLLLVNFVLVWVPVIGWFLIVFITWPAGVIWAAIAAAEHNKRLGY